MFHKNIMARVSKHGKCTLFSSMKAFIESMKAFIEKDVVLFKKCTLYVHVQKVSSKCTLFPSM